MSVGTLPTFYVLQKRKQKKIDENNNFLVFGVV